MSVTFSPALLLGDTQVLKDSFFMLVVVVAFASTTLLIDCLERGPLEHPYLLLGGIAGGAVAVALIGGIRAYYAMIVWGAVAAAFLIGIVVQPGARRLSSLLASCGVLGVLGLACLVGSADYYQYYARAFTAKTGISLPTFGRTARSSLLTADPGDIVGTLTNARNGFARSGGNTSLVRHRADDGGRGVEERVEDVAVGLAAIFVPISILRATSIVEIEGGRGLLAVTDIDTLFLDLTLLAIGILIWQGRHQVRRHVPALAFFAVVLLVSTMGLAYVVTNFGTMFRLRLMVAAPVWLCPLALRRTFAAAPSLAAAWAPRDAWGVAGLLKDKSAS